ncbi:hypothetical protein [Sandaracinus amylolyticus]|uniref:hypothetical protein n=1 Tax=Sandaracinus amylolyticus TaxID=927083 RepID=UPI001F3EDEA7|nr:hypothetical protein [Sandaracinus amylolyticus]UJR79179.1 Hypothetical protein I5071_12120 [Sandaracinus amylolyticus]
MTLRWDAITSGETFQSLAAQIVRRVDAHAHVFTWPGPDGGQDARSGDGETVYQAKHHARPEARHPREDALKELSKIRAYREPTHPRHPQWASVRRWVLLTNVATQATEAERWDREVVPAFTREGLNVELWGAERLEQHVSEFPALKRAFFDGETRAFISLGEALHYARTSDPAAHEGELPTFRGRDELVTEIVARFATAPIVPLVAPAGVGSSRLALAVAIEAVTAGVVPAVYFANPANLAADTRWYEAFVPDQPMLVVLDELDENDGLRSVKRILEEMRTRAPMWKLLVVTKTHQQHLRTAVFVRAADTLEVPPLQEDATASLIDEIVRRRVPANALLERQLGRVARAVAHDSEGFPAWAVLSALTVASGGSLSRVPGSRREQVQTYLHTIRERVSREMSSGPAVVRVLRAVAALGTLDAQRDGHSSWVREMANGISSEQLREILEALERLRVVRRRGVNRRLWSVVPAVLSDAVLAEWLTDDARTLAPNANALDLVTWLREAIASGPNPQSPVVPVLRRLARMAFVGAEHAQPISHAIRGLFRDARARGEQALDLEWVIDLAENIAHSMPGIAVDLALHVLRGGTSNENMRVRSRVPWLLFHAACGARTSDERREVVGALERAAHAEARSPTRNEQDGKSAPRVIKRILDSIDEVVSDFTLEFEAMIAAMLAGMPPDPARIDSAAWFIEPLVHAEGFTTHFERDTFHYGTYRVHPESERAKARWRVLDRLWGILEHEPSSPWRPLAWRMLIASRSAMLFGSDDPRDRTRAHLQRAVGILTAHQALGLDELRAARRTWSWHLEYGDEPAEKALAEQCEAHYVRAVRADPATNILLGDEFQADLEPVRTGSAIDVAQMFAAILDAAERLDDDFAWARARRIADYVGGLPRAECREAWFLISPRAHAGPRHAGVVTEYLGGVLSAARRTGDRAIVDLWRDVDLRASALAVASRAALYGNRLTVAAELVQEDLASFSERVSELAASYPLETFSALGRMVRLGCAANQLVADAWLATSDAVRARCFAALVEGTYSAIATDETARTSALSTWLLDQLVEVPDPDHVFSGASDWHLEQVLAKCGRPSVEWVATFLAQRAERYDPDGHTYDVVPYTTPLHHFVDVTVVDPTILTTVFRYVVGEALVPKWLSALDPSRSTLIELMAAEIDAARTRPEQLARAARWALCFVENGAEWRRLAQRAAGHASAFPSDDRDRVYRQMVDRHRLYTSKSGEISPARLQELREAQTRLDEEQDPALRDYWRWRLEDVRASIEYDRQALEER